MNSPVLRWKKMLLFCLGLAFGAAFCMKWMEPDFWSNGEKFTILGLEWFYPKEKVAAILSGLSPAVKMSLRYHLSFDFAFMAGVYPGIASVCMIIAEKAGPATRKILFALAALQLLAWLGDIGENYYLLQWTTTPQIGSEWSWYHFLVAMKWLIAVFGILIPVIILLSRLVKRK